MRHLFVPYGIAVMAKDAGFNESCFAYYDRQNLLFTSSVSNKDWSKKQCKSDLHTAPLYQQLTDWFREKHKIEVNIFSVLPFIYGYSFEYMDAWSKEDKSTALHLLDQVLYAEKQTIGKPINDWKELKYTYYEAYNAALIEAFKLIK